MYLVLTKLLSIACVFLACGSLYAGDWNIEDPLDLAQVTVIDGNRLELGVYGHGLTNLEKPDPISELMLVDSSGEYGGIVINGEKIADATFSFKDVPPGTWTVQTSNVDTSVERPYVDETELQMMLAEPSQSN